jgi:putative transposase
VSAFRFIEREKATIATACRVLGVSRSGFHAWRRRPKSARALEDEVLALQIARIHADSRGTYGAPRVHAELRLDHGVRCGRKRIARLMRQAALCGVTRRRRYRSAQGVRETAPAPDLVNREFAAAAPGALWVADITYVSTEEGFLYLAVVIDVFSRKVAGWAMRRSLETEIVTAALDMAIARTRPDPGLIHHSDRGSQYTSFGMGRRLREAGILPSMGSTGDAYDNALAESFFGTLECELLDRTRFRSRAAARLALFDWLETWYNPRRRHSSLAMLAPLEFERRWQLEAALT